jgi:hypothetical protein
MRLNWFINLVLIRELLIEVELEVNMRKIMQMFLIKLMFLYLNKLHKLNLLNLNKILRLQIKINQLKKIAVIHKKVNHLFFQ